MTTTKCSETQKLACTSRGTYLGVTPASDSEADTQMCTHFNGNLFKST